MIPIEDEPGTMVYGRDIRSFCEHVSAIRSSVIYFHNLAFDGSFMLDWLLKNGYRHTSQRSPRKSQFTTLISSMGKFYSLKICWKNGHRTELRDSLKKLPMSVANVAKAFKLDTIKGEIDYDAYRPIGHDPTQDELDYLYNDVAIVSQALAVQRSQGMKKLTVGADSMAEFKSLMGSDLFDRMFPVLPVSMDAEIRKAYRGGFTYVDPRHKGKVIGAGRVYDVNSLYPSVMYSRPMPYGVPDFTEGDPTETGKLWIGAVTITAKLKPNRIPCIQIKGSLFFGETEYLSEITEPTMISCTSVDFALWQDQYDIEVLSWEGAWIFRSVDGIFTKYIDKWMKVKEESEGGLRLIAKLHLNSLYGKFATNPDVTPKIPVLDGDVVRLVRGIEETRDPVYTAVGAFITAYARDVTVRAAQDHYEHFVYADTDSLHLLIEDDPETLDIHPSRLGAWKHETTFARACYARAKAYCEELPDGSSITHVAGLPEAIAETVTLESFTPGRVFGGKLTPTRVNGGIVLTNVTYTLKF